MKKNSLIFLLIANCLHSMELQLFAESQNDAQEEALLSITPSSEMPKYSKEYCRHVLDAAPLQVKGKAQLLINPETRKLILPYKLILYGPSGSGKTTLTKVIAQEIGSPYLFVEAASLGNPKLIGLKLAGEMVAKNNFTLIIDDFDCIDELTLKHSRILDVIKQNKLIFLASLNNPKRIEGFLRRNLFTALSEVPIPTAPEVKRKIINVCFKDIPLESPKIIETLIKETNNQSLFFVENIIEYAISLALSRDTENLIITMADINGTIQYLKKEEKFLRNEKVELTKENLIRCAWQIFGTVGNIIFTTRILSNWKRYIDIYSTLKH